MKYFKLILIFFFYNFNLANSDTNIVYLDVQYIIDNSNLGIFYKKKILKIQNDLKTDLSIREKDIKKKEADINNQKNILKKEELDKNIKKLNNTIKEYKIFRNDSNKTILNQKKKYSKIILENLNPILTEFAENNNITLILEKKNILVGSKVLDITDEIIKLLNEDAAKKKIN